MKKAVLLDDSFMIVAPYFDQLMEVDNNADWNGRFIVYQRFYRT
jgi:hypothetical protein